MNLDRLYSPNSDVVAYGYAEVDSPSDRDAELLVGSDDTITVWVNGKKVHETTGDRGWAFDQDHVPVHFDKGVNKVLIRCGNTAGPWEFSVAVSGEADKYVFLKGGAKKFNLDDFRVFARKNPGDAQHGEKLFRDLKGLACIKCHAVGGEGGQVGPDLAGIALKYKREDLMTSVLEPSKVIAQGYETIVIDTDKGISLSGVFKGETADAVSLADKDGKLIVGAEKGDRYAEILAGVHDAERPQRRHDASGFRGRDRVPGSAEGGEAAAEEVTGRFHCGGRGERGKCRMEALCFSSCSPRPPR